MAFGTINASEISTNSTSIPVQPTTPAPMNFSDFQFKTIGQQPNLLQRMSTPDGDIQMSHDSDIPSPPPQTSPDPYIINDLLPADELAKTQRLPSLRERMSIQNDKPNDFAPTQARPVEPVLTTIFGWKPHVANRVAPVATHANAKGSLPSTIASQKTSIPSDSDLTRGHEILKISGDRRTTSKQPEINATIDVDTIVSLEATNISNSGNLLQPPSRTSLAVAATSSSGRPSNEHSKPQVATGSSLATLRTYHWRISTAITNLTVISAEEARRLAQVAKHQSAEVTASADRAYQLARKALICAEESMNSACECLTVAETIQTRTDEVLAAVEKIGSEKREQEWQNSLKAIEADLLQTRITLDQMEAQEATRRRELEAERQTQEASVQLYRTNSRQSTVSSTLTSKPDDLHIARQEAPSDTMGVENEADAAAKAWSRIREQTAERRRLAEEEINKRRATEEALEQEQKSAQASVAVREAQLARIRAERIAAEQREKARQEKEAQAGEMQQKELARKREEAAELQFRRSKTSEDCTSAAGAKANEEAAYLAKQGVEKREEEKETLERETLRRRLEAEREEALEAARQQQLLHDQETKRQEVAAEKQRAAAEAAKRIQSDRAKRKQTSPVDKTSTPSVHNLSLPPIAVHQSIESKSTLIDAGIAVPKKAVVGDTSESKKKVKRTIADADSEHLLHHIYATVKPSTPNQSSSNSLSPALLITPLLANTAHAPSKSNNLDFDRPSVRPEATHVQPTNQPICIDGHNDVPPLAAPTQSNEVSPIGISQVSKDNLPSVISLPATSTSTIAASQVLAHSNVVVRNPNAGGAYLPPSTHLLPMATEANLRPLMDMNGLQHVTTMKRDPDEAEIAVKLQWKSAAPMNPESLSTSLPSESDQGSSADGMTTGFLQSRAKCESPSEIPILSLPSPSSATTPFNDSTLSPPPPPPQFQFLDNEPSQPNLFDFTRLGRGLDSYSAQNVVSKPTQLGPLSQPCGRSSTPIRVPAEQNLHARGISDDLSISRLATATLPPRPPACVPKVPLSIASTQPSSVKRSAVIESITSDYFDSDFTSRMGPDALATGGWNQPVLEDYGVDPATNQRQTRARQSRPARRAEVDQISPPPPPSSSTNNRGSNRLSRRVDHYSPSRQAPSPLSTYNVGSIRHSSDCSRSGGPMSISNSRGVTPEPYYSPQDNSWPLPPPYVASRKRALPGDQPSGPPMRRPRYESPRENMSQAGPSRSQYLSSGDGLREGWSPTADCSRSSTPERHRTISLQNRLGEANYRPQSAGNRGKQQGHNSNHRAGNPQRPPNSSGSQPAYSADSYRDVHDGYNLHKQDNRNSNYGSPPQLLARLTDSPAYPPSMEQEHPSNGRAVARRGRGGAPNLSSGQRTPKNHLINRLQGPKDKR